MHEIGVKLPHENVCVQVSIGFGFTSNWLRQCMATGDCRTKIISFREKVNGLT